MRVSFLCFILTLCAPAFAQDKAYHEQVRHSVETHIQDIKTCFDQVLRKKPGLKGKVVLEWQISIGGRVENAKVKSSTIEIKSLQECLLTKLQSWQFPLPPAGEPINVSYPFVLAPPAKRR